MREARDRGFKSQPNDILREYFSHRYRLFYRAFGTAFGVPVQETGTKGHFQLVPKGVFLVVLFPELSVPFPFTRTDGNDNLSIRFLPDPYTCVSSLGFMEGAPQTPNKAS